MKHIILTNAWEFQINPFPAYRANLVYGRNKQDREFLPVKDEVIPMAQYTVMDYGKTTTLYIGTDKAAAEAAKAKYDAAVEHHNVSAGRDENPRPPAYWQLAKMPADEIRVGLPTLPEGKFRVIKTREKGTILVVPGSDDTNRCLLFVGCAGGFRGGVGVIKDGTTGSMIKECSAGNACESSIEVIVLLEVGQSVAFHTFGRRTNEVYLYTWNGTDVEKKNFSKSEWDDRNVITEDAEVL